MRGVIAIIVGLFILGFVILVGSGFHHESTVAVTFFTKAAIVSVSMLGAALSGFLQFRASIPRVGYSEAVQRRRDNFPGWIRDVIAMVIVSSSGIAIVTYYLLTGLLWYLPGEATFERGRVVTISADYGGNIACAAHVLIKRDNEKTLNVCYKQWNWGNWKPLLGQDDLRVGDAVNVREISNMLGVAVNDVSVNRN